MGKHQMRALGTADPKLNIKYECRDPADSGCYKGLQSPAQGVKKYLFRLLTDAHH